RVAIDKGEAARSVVITGRKIDYHPLVGFVRVAEHSDNKLPIVNAVFPFIQKDPGQGGPRVRNIAHLLVNPKTGRTETRRVSPVKPCVHGDTAHPGHRLAFVRSRRGFDPRFVSRTLPDARAVSAVGPERTLLNVFFDVPIASVPAAEIQVPFDPVIGIARRPGLRQFVLAVIYVKSPGQHHLLAVVEAHDPLRLGFGFRQRWQEQARQNCDDANDDQQFDQCETASAVVAQVGLHRSFACNIAKLLARSIPPARPDIKQKSAGDSESGAGQKSNHGLGLTLLRLRRVFVPKGHVENSPTFLTLGTQIWNSFGFELILVRSRIKHICFSLLGALSLTAHAADSDAMKLFKTIPLPDVTGRFDHFSIDVKNQRLFVAALGNNSVEVLDLNAGKRLRSITGCDKPQGVLYLPKGNLLCVANGGNGRLRIYDCDSFKPLATIGSLDDADNLRYDARADRVYVGYGNGALGVVNPTTGVLSGSVKLLGHPESFQLEQDGNRIFVNVPGARHVAVIDRSTRTLLEAWLLPNAQANFPMALDETNHRLFVGCREPARLLVLDTTTGKAVSDAEISGDTDDLFY